MFTYPLLSKQALGGVVGDFETAAMAYGPLAMYTFRDTDFSTKILDSTTNANHLLKKQATAARGAALRSGHPGGLVFPAVDHTTGPWATAGVWYQDDAGGLDDLIAGSVACSWIVGINITSLSTNGSNYVLCVGDEGVSAAGSNVVTFAQITGTANSLKTGFFCTGGNTVVDLLATPDGVTRIVTSRYFGPDHSNPDRGPRMASSTKTVDTTDDSVVYNYGLLQTRTKPTFLGGRTISGGTGVSGAYTVDFIAVYDFRFTDTQMNDLHDLYQIEMN